MKKQSVFTKQLLRFSLLLACFTVISAPIITYADNNVFDWIEDEDGELEDEENVEKDEGDLLENIEDETDDKEDQVVGLTAWDYTKTLFALVFVVGLLYAVLKFINRRSRLYDQNRLMKNVGGISLGQQKSIQLINVGSTYYLVGVGEDIRLLKEITDPDEIDALLAYYEGEEELPFKGPFEKLLAKIVPFQKKEVKQQPSENEAFSDLLNSRLTEIKADRKRQFHRLTEKERHEDE